MRVGCGGCLVGLFVGASVAGCVLGGAWVVTLVLEEPAMEAPVTTAEDAASAQRKIFALYQRSGERARAPVVLSEREINALVRRTLADTIPFSPLIVRLRGEDQAELAGRLRIEDLLDEAPLSRLRAWLPSTFRQRRVWLRTTVHAQVQPGRHPHVQLVPLTAAIGRLPIAALALPWLLEPDTLAYLRWTLPEGARGLRIERGRVIITTAG